MAQLYAHPCVSVVDCSMDQLPTGTLPLPPMSDTRNLVGSQFTFECQDGYNVTGCSEAGDHTFVCKENGKWSIGSLYCQGKLIVLAMTQCLVSDENL